MKSFGPARDEDSALDELATAGAETISQVAGAALGLAILGPPGAVVGAAAGPVLSHTLRKVGREVKQRMLSHREESRIGAVFLLATDETRSRLDAGEQVRTDEFFNEDTAGRSTAEEITEAVFRAAQREYEERKLPYLASMLTGLAFEPTISRSQAVSIVRVAEALSYRQFCLMALYERVGQLPHVQTQERSSNTPFALNTSSAAGERGVRHASL